MIESDRGRDQRQITGKANETEPDQTGRRRDSCGLSPQNPPGRGGMERWLSWSWSVSSPKRRSEENVGIGGGERSVGLAVLEECSCVFPIHSLHARPGDYGQRCSV